MDVTVDEQWRITTSAVADTSRLNVLVRHPRTALQHLRAVLDGVAIDVGEESALLSQAWLKSACTTGAGGGVRRFAELMEGLHRHGIDEEKAGYIRASIQWDQAVRLNQDCLGRQKNCAGVWRVCITGTAHGFDCRKDQPVLQAAIAAGAAAIRSGCHGGGCGICKIRVLSGTFRSGAMSRAHVGPESCDRSDVLACRIYPLSNLVIEPLGKAKERFSAQADQFYKDE